MAQMVFAGLYECVTDGSGEYEDWLLAQWGEHIETGPPAGENAEDEGAEKSVMQAVGRALAHAIPENHQERALAVFLYGLAWRPNLYLGLHTGPPTTDNEAGYARLAVPLDAAHWNLVGEAEDPGMFASNAVGLVWPALDRDVHFPDGIWVGAWSAPTGGSLLGLRQGLGFGGRAGRALFHKRMK
jgi:hypothetical protein